MKFFLPESSPNFYKTFSFNTPIQSLLQFKSFWGDKFCQLFPYLEKFYKKVVIIFWNGNGMWRGVSKSQNALGQLLDSFQLIVQYR